MKHAMRGTLDAPRYPDIYVSLAGVDTNAGSILGHVTRAMAGEGVPTVEIDQFRLEAMSGNYEELIQTCMCWVVVR